MTLLGYYIYQILFMVIWHIISQRKCTVAQWEAEGHSTFPRGDNMPYHHELNVTIILLHNSLKICYLTVQNCTHRFLPCDMACDSIKYHKVNWPIRRQERKVICYNTCTNYHMTTTKYHTFCIICDTITSFQRLSHPGWYQCRFPIPGLISMSHHTAGRILMSYTFSRVFFRMWRNSAKCKQPNRRKCLKWTAW